MEVPSAIHPGVTGRGRRGRPAHDPVYEAGEAGGVLSSGSGRQRRGRADRAAARGPAASGPGLNIISPVASALDAAHAAGLVHRDVKPGNMLLDSRPGLPDHVYLSDFGLARTGESAGLTCGPVSRHGALRAPEQITGQFVDGRADQYALACAAFELLTGDVPFAACEGWAVFSAHMNNPPPALTDHRPDLPPAATRRWQAMAKSPEAGISRAGVRGRAARGPAWCPAPRPAHGADLGRRPAPAAALAAEKPGRAGRDGRAGPAGHGQRRERGLAGRAHRACGCPGRARRACHTRRGPGRSCPRRANQPRRPDPGHRRSRRA